MVKRAVLVLFLFFTSSCITLNRPNPSPPKEAVDFLNAQKSLDDNNSVEAEKNFQAFLEEHPYSVFRLKGLLGLSEALFLQSKYEEALPPINEVISQAQSQADNKSLLALALFKSGALLRVLNQEELSNARLRDANNLSSFLPERIRHIELPFLLSMTYSRLGLLADSEVEAEKVIKGLSKEAQNYSPKEKSEIYLTLGRPSDRIVDKASFESVVSELMVGQKLLLLSIEQKEPATQKLALDLLMNQYNKLYQVLKINSQVSTPELNRLAELLLESLIRLENFIQIDAQEGTYPAELFTFKDKLKEVLLKEFIYPTRSAK